MVHSYAGRNLLVDLGSRHMDALDVDADLCRKYLGGYGFGAKYLLDNQPPGVSPLDPRTVLGFTTGPLTGTPAVIGARYMVVYKSPLTHCWGDSNSGGDFGPRLKLAGFDNVFIHGAADEWSYLLIDDGSAELRPAESLVGRDTNEVEVALAEVHGKDIGVASIGPAGEKLSLMASVINNSGRAAARSGVGAVLGSKKLKAIVVKGNRQFPVFDPDGLRELRKQVIARFDGPIYELLRDYGTCGLVEDGVESGDCPTRNWRGSGTDSFPSASLIGGDNVIAHRKGKYGCFRCPLACGGHMHASPPEAEYEYAATHKPEYETLAAFGALCLNDNIHSIIKANEICNRYGLDTISAGSTIAFAIECFENGVITRQDTDGLVLTWGNHQAIVEMTERMARREGFGDVLADGVQLAAERIGGGAEEYAIHIQGQELPMHHPRVMRGLAATYWLDPTPARHMQGHEEQMPTGFDPPAYDPTSWGGRGPIHRVASNLVHVVSCAGLCMFSMDVSTLQDMIGFLNAATGWDCDVAELDETGERIANLRQIFNIREGHIPHLRSFPEIVRHNPDAGGGPLANVEVDYETAGRDWMREMRWDLTTGEPDPMRLKELGIEEYAL